MTTSSDGWRTNCCTACRAIPDTGRSYVVAGTQAPGAGGGRSGPPGRPRPGSGRAGQGHRGEQRQSAGGPLLPAGPGIPGGGRAVSQDPPMRWPTSWWACNQGKPVYLRDVAQVIDGPEEPVALSTIAFGPAEELPPGLRAGPVLPGGDHGRGQTHRHQRGDRGPGHPEQAGAN